MFIWSIAQPEIDFFCFLYTIVDYLLARDYLIARDWLAGVTEKKTQNADKSQ